MTGELEKQEPSFSLCARAKHARSALSRTIVLSCPMIPVMTTSSGQRVAKRSEARERLLSTASRLFYSEGISGVGVDRIVSEGHVTLATFYRHFPSKEDLVISYLEGVHDAIAEQITAIVTQAQGPEGVRGPGGAGVPERAHHLTG